MNKDNKYQSNLFKNYQPQADLKFNKKIVDFGNIPQDTLLIAKYYFTNTSNNNLIINYVNPDCVCTNYKLSKKIVMPGDSAYIQLEFDTRNKIGQQKIYATVSANTKTKMYILILKANVVKMYY